MRRGRPGADGELCPYLAHEPATDAGWAAWDTLLRCAGQLRVAATASSLGLDLAAAIDRRHGTRPLPAALAELLPAGEAGLVRALNERLDREP